MLRMGFKQIFILLVMAGSLMIVWQLSGQNKPKPLEYVVETRTIKMKGLDKAAIWFDRSAVMEVPLPTKSVELRLEGVFTEPIELDPGFLAIYRAFSGSELKPLVGLVGREILMLATGRKDLPEKISNTVDVRLQGDKGLIFTIASKAIYVYKSEKEIHIFIPFIKRQN